MSISTVNVPVARPATISQWGVFDRRKGKVIRTHLTREKARNYARRSKFYTVVSRPILVGIWE
jgi:hypothetical protein